MLNEKPLNSLRKVSLDRQLLSFAPVNYPLKAE
jgi:hypothetical protein